MRNLAATLGTRRLVLVGGAGSLEVDDTRLVDTTDFPAIYRTDY